MKRTNIGEWSNPVKSQ